MEFRDVRERPADRPPDSATARASGGPEQGGRGAAAGDAARLARRDDGSRAEGGRAEGGRPVGAPDGPVPDSVVRRPESLARPPMRPDRQKWLERLERAENRSGVRDQLRDRMNQLEPGHPSSPWHEDGTPRPPAPRLTDLERQDPRLSDTDYKAHVEDVKRELALAGERKLTTKELYTIDGNGRAWVADRRHVHDEIIKDIYDSAAHVPCDHKAVIAGGLGGSGKTTVLEHHAGVDRSEFLTINPDDIKEELIRRDLVPRLPGLSPMESAPLAHEESSHIAKHLAIRAMADGKNIIWDVTLSSPESASGRVAELRTAGYQHIEGIFVDIPIETSVDRAAARHRRGHERFLAGEGLGGRFVSEDIIRAQHDPAHGSINRKAFESVKDDLSRWAVYDNSATGLPPILVEEKDSAA